MTRAILVFVAFMAVTVDAAVGQQPNPKASTNINRYGSTPWYGEPGIRQQLKITDEQYGRLNQNYSSAYNTFNQSASELGNLTEQQQRDRLNQNYGTFYKNLDTSTQGVLTPEQRARYNQLWIQYRGYDALLDPSNRQTMNLTEAQAAALQKYNTEYQQKMNEYTQQYGTNKEAATKGYQQIQPQINERINQTLTEQQRQRWSEMTGSPYRFQPFYGYGNPQK